MDLVKEFDEILRNYGYNVLILRQKNDIRCSCWNEKKKEFSRSCPVCFGVGKTPLVEKHTVRSEETSVPETLAMLGKDSTFGGMAVPGRYYYIKETAEVRTEDLIIEVDWINGDPKYRGNGIFKVSHVDNFEFLKGERVYKKVYTRDTPVLKTIRGIRVAEQDGIINYEIAMKDGD